MGATVRRRPVVGSARPRYELYPIIRDLCRCPIFKPTRVIAQLFSSGRSHPRPLATVQDKIDHHTKTRKRGSCRTSKSSDRTNRTPVESEVAVPEEIDRTEAQAPRIVIFYRIRRRRPEFAVRAEVVEGGTRTNAGSGQEDALRRIGTFTHDESAGHAISRCPRGRTVVDKRRELRIRRHPPRCSEMRGRRIVRGDECTSRINVTRRLKLGVNLTVSPTIATAE